MIEKIRTDSEAGDSQEYRIGGGHPDGFHKFVFQTSSMEKINNTLIQLKNENSLEEKNLIIQGEVGTGKNELAKMIHHESRRAKDPWVQLNCVFFPDTVLEQKLFGHTQAGAIELAKGGTLVLSRIEKLDLSLQQKLLQALKSRRSTRMDNSHPIEMACRVIATSTEDLKKKVQQGKFIEELYQKLGEVILNIPSLRERKVDIIPFAHFLAEEKFREQGKSFHGFTAETERALQEYSWPGNIKELETELARAVLTWNKSGPLPVRALSVPVVPVPFHPAKNESVAVPIATTDKPNTNNVISISPTEISLSYTELKKRWCDSFEKEYLVAILNRHSGNVSAAAREAKLDRSNFLRLLRRHSLKAEIYRKAAA